MDCDGGDWALAEDVKEVYWTGERIRRWLLTIWIVGFSIVVILMYRDSRSLVEANRERIEEIQEAKDLFCKLHVIDNKLALRDAREYLVTHPNGAPGIPRSLIETGISRRKTRLVELRKANCDTSIKIPKEKEVIK